MKKEKIISPTLSKHVQHNISKNSNIKGIHSYTCKASMTVEAAFIFPFFAGFLIIILFVFRVLQIETDVETALNYASRKTASLAAVTEESSILLAGANAYFYSNLAYSELESALICGGAVGISLFASDVTSEDITLRATYYLKPPINFWNRIRIPVTQYAKSKKWTGFPVEENNIGTEYVYITETGTAYHATAQCNYLDLSIRRVRISSVRTLRNRNAHKYNPCSRCVAENCGGNGLVYCYITDYGEYYHQSLSCSSLKRTVIRISIDEIDGRTPCRKCY